MASTLEHNAGVIEMWEQFKNQLEELVKSHIPHKMAKRRDSSPWITPEIKNKRRDGSPWITPEIKNKRRDSSPWITPEIKNKRRDAHDG